MPSNDNEPEKRGPALTLSESHGRAALLLVESLIHGLCENETITTGRAIEIAERAVSVEREEAEAAGGVEAPAWRSHALLSAIAASLRIDDDSGPMPPRRVS